MGLGLYDHAEERAWRHLDTCQFVTYLHARPPRVACLGKAADDVRKREHRVLREDGDEVLAGSKYAWLYAGPNVPSQRRLQVLTRRRDDTPEGETSWHG